MQLLIYKNTVFSEILAFIYTKKNIVMFSNSKRLQSTTNVYSSAWSWNCKYKHSILESTPSPSPQSTNNQRGRILVFLHSLRPFDGFLIFFGNVSNVYRVRTNNYYSFSSSRYWPSSKSSKLVFQFVSTTIKRVEIKHLIISRKTPIFAR